MMIPIPHQPHQKSMTASVRALGAMDFRYLILHKRIHPNRNVIELSPQP